jgi:hypothetical protein
MTTAPSSEVRDLLLKARALLKGHWIRGAYQDGNKYCAIGALIAARQAGHYSQAQYTKARIRLCSVVKERVGDALPVETYNDGFAGGEEDVLSLFCEAAGGSKPD